nr:sigma-70 family RNA polymerase sigma factor [Acetobacter garciniae]
MSETQARWLAEEILPHEADVRRWLSRFSGIDVDDVIQEAWIALSRTEPATIRFPRRWFFKVARNVVLQYYRRARIVPLSSLSDITDDTLVDSEPGPEQHVSAREELQFLSQTISDLPPRCRAIFTLHRIHGYSRKDCASRLGLSENVIEKQMARALRLIGDAYAQREKDHETGYRSFPHVGSWQNNAG